MADIVCPSCSTQYRIHDSQLAKASKLRCKKCGTIFHLHDNIKTEPPTLPEETEHLVQQPSGLETVDFDFSNLQIDSPQSEPFAHEEATRTHVAQNEKNDLSLDSNGENISLDFDSPTAPPSLDPISAENLTFPGAEDASAGENGEEIHDHITVPTQDHSTQGGTDFAEFSFASSGDDEEHEPSEAPVLDFSFSAATPDAPEEGDEDWDDEEDWEEEDDVSEPIPDEIQDKAPPVPPPVEEEEEFEDDEESEEEDLSTCCVDSLAMGLQRCELCGRDLTGKAHTVAQELQQQRKQQLREELIAGDVQVGFSEEANESLPEAQLHKTEDFSDVEQALDALADGTFHHKIKKKQAKKTFVKKLKMAAGGVIALLVIAGLVSVLLLPSSHEKLQARYDQLMAQEEIDPGQLVQLFFDAAIKQDSDIFSRLTTMSDMPEIKSGRVLSVGEEYEKLSLGALGKRITELEQTIIKIEQESTQKTALLQEYSAKNLSPGIIEDRIEQDEKKLAALHDEFETNDRDISKKLHRLQQDLQKTEQEITKNRKLSRKYIDATDAVGKALYENSVTKQKFLAEQKGKLQLHIQQEDAKYRKLRQELEAEYQPRFSKIEERLETERTLFHEATLLQDKAQSPVVLLTKELERLTQAQIEKKEELEATQEQLDAALAFFEAQVRTQITQEQQNAEFIQARQNVAASVKIGGSSEQRVSIVLKRYQAILPDKTFTGKWLVEKLAK